MCPNQYNRLRQRGNSFGSCLLTLVIVFGGIGFYYFNYFQWRHFENPTAGLSYEKDVSLPQMNEFRKAAVAKVIDPAKAEIERVVEIRKKTKKGSVKYAEMDQDVIEVRNRLKEIMNEARLRRIPSKFKKEYNESLEAMKDTYLALNALEDSFDQETEAARNKLYNQSIKLTNKAKKRSTLAREYFLGSAWSQ